MNSRDCESGWFLVRRKRLKSVAFTAALTIVWALAVIVGVTTITRP